MSEHKVIVKACVYCAMSTTIRVKMTDFIAWQLGEKLIQDCFPYLSDSDRELLITATCSTCFDRFFPPREG